MRNSGKKRGSTGDPLFCLKTSRGRPSRRAVCAACRGRRAVAVADQQDVHGFDVRRKGELLAHGFGFEHADPQRVEVQRRGGKHHVVGDDRRVDVRNVLAVVLTGPRLGGVGADDDGRRGAEIARAARKAFHALLRLHDHQPLGLAVGARGGHAARFEDQLQFLRLHLPGEVFAAGVPLFRQFQKIHLQRF